MKPSEELDIVAEEMQKRPWVKHNFVAKRNVAAAYDHGIANWLRDHPRAGCCLQGAARVATGSPLSGAAEAYLLRAARQRSWVPAHIINDFAESKAQVLGYLRKAAELARKEDQ